ncbi:hypothetical protein QAD02_002107 [Eretmocerus hayati]|uniref:Uncharacterized protein n=1 Tax=Eretmocerus hayati TaxID=131215 RepID=A0ACC2NJ64_9HYME|nr:hypothetical protein QAD02_002107 [Eretmocerus hayati]
MKRGRILEPKVLAIVGQALNTKWGQQGKVKRTGLRMKKEYASIGASPDGETDVAVLEIKCPSDQKTVKNYYGNNKMKDKYRAQLQGQMFFANKSIGYFCVADPEIEVNKRIKIIREIFDKPFTLALLTRAMDSWRKAIFPRSMECC